MFDIGFSLTSIGPSIPLAVGSVEALIVSPERLGSSCVVSRVSIFLFDMRRGIVVQLPAASPQSFVSALLIARFLVEVRLRRASLSPGPLFHATELRIALGISLLGIVDVWPEDAAPPPGQKRWIYPTSDRAILPDSHDGCFTR